MIHPAPVANNLAREPNSAPPLALDCLILAAGAASRFGSCKLLANWQGQPMLSASIRAARAVSPSNIVVVGGASYSQLRHAQADWCGDASDVELLYCRDWQLGMGHSLAFGVSRLAENNAVMVLLADQPLISAADLQHLHTAWRQGQTRITCASFSGALGVPAIFPPAYKRYLLASSGDAGARKFLQQNANDICAVAIAAAEFDVDTKQDLVRLAQKM